MLKKVDKPKTLKEYALEQLRNAIMLGQFKPGERLVERVLCEKLAVSRTVIRECIRHLESEQLVSVIPHTGPIVARLNVKEVKEIYSVRAVLESEAVAKCAENADHLIVSKLRSYISEIKNCLNSNEIIAALQQTRLFYQTIFEVADSTVAWELVNQLNGRVMQLRVMTLGTDERKVQGPQNLEDMVDAIAKNDSIKAKNACIHHIENASKVGIAILTNMAEDISLIKET